MKRDRDSSNKFRGVLCRRLVSLIALIAAMSAGCAKKDLAPRAPSAVPVTVARVRQQMMPVEVTAVGNVEAISTVSIRPQVSGQLLEVHFKEGDFVRKGQLLLTIDSRQYQAQVEQARGAIVKDQAQVAQAEANLARDRANEEYARGEAQRYANLWEKGLISRENFDQMKSQAAAALQSLSADKAAIDSARADLLLNQGVLDLANIQLSYCKIYAPIDGRTGAVLQNTGNLLKAADAPVVVINQVDPIDVNFTVPQQYWTEVKKHLADPDFRVAASVPQGAGEPEQGVVTFVDSAVDASTGTIHLKARFPNSQNRLWPGLFVNTVLRLSEEPNAIVIPAQAIAQAQDGPLVYVVGANKTVEPRPVVFTRTSGEWAVIDKGLQRDEIVVIDGQARLAQGMRVETKEDERVANEVKP